MTSGFLTVFSLNKGQLRCNFIPHHDVIIFCSCGNNKETLYNRVNLLSSQCRTEAVDLDWVHPDSERWYKFVWGLFYSDEYSMRAYTRMYICAMTKTYPKHMQHHISLWHCFWNRAHFIQNYTHLYQTQMARPINKPIFCNKVLCTVRFNVKDIHCSDISDATVCSTAYLF